MCTVSHHFFEGTVYHKRYTPVVHEFRYPFFLLDIDLDFLASLKNRLFSLGGLNLFAFKSKDHFGEHEHFIQNVEELLQKFGLEASEHMRFITLPRVANFVFNPISLLILFENEKPSHLFAEVHNYNGGRVVYPLKLKTNDKGVYEGEVMKTMYVSPFLDTSGEYRFYLHYDARKFSLKIDLYDDEAKKLTASFSGQAKPFEGKTVAKLFLRHSFLTLWVVTRTIWQSLKLKRKGLIFYEPTPSDQIRRY
jgi:DUF1365 family protein